MNVRSRPVLNIRPKSCTTSRVPAPWIRGIIGLAGALALTALPACKRQDASDEAEVTPTVSVETAPVLATSLSPTVRAVGTVVSSPTGYAELSAPAPTRVMRVLVTPGQHVGAGQPLVQLDASAMRSSAAGAEAAQKAAQSAFDRASRLAKQGILPQKAVDQASSDLAQANAAAVAARRTYALSTLASPISGVVTEMNAVTGASVDPTQVLVAIADPRALQILLHVSPADAAGVRAGSQVPLFESDTQQSALPVAHGVVATVGAAVDSATRTVPVRLRIVSSTRPLRLGETVVGILAVRGATTAVTIPPAALVPDSAGFKVYVVKGGVAYSTPVEVGTRGDSLVQITKGLTPGQVVVTTGAYGLEDSSKVTVPKR